ncbi:hypothetical protein OCU04_008645 [Sclerotinia nivalis]|uniref:Uncharacterized protein n=1 Tax=Sclerotinia nivalis TaxID=352851 RepID=A0A9X0AIH6_9HELO|nr:hypothetical protein OCU04_008645 [Sclerotinia nivalis]
MNPETMDQAYTSVVQFIDYAKTLYRLLEDLGISQESIHYGIVVGLVFFLVYLILRSVVRFFEHFFDSVVRLFKHFFDFLRSLIVVGPLGLLILIYSLTSNLERNQQFVLALIAIFLFGIIAVCLILKRIEGGSTEMTRVQTVAAKVQTDATGVQTNAAGVRRDAAGVQTGAVGIQ